MTQIQKHNTSNIQWLFIDLHKYNSGGKGKVHDEMLFSGNTFLNLRGIHELNVLPSPASS